MHASNIRATPCTVCDPHIHRVVCEEAPSAAGVPAPVEPLFRGPRPHHPSSPSPSPLTLTLSHRSPFTVHSSQFTVHRSPFTRTGTGTRTGTRTCTRASPPPHHHTLASHPHPHPQLHPRHRRCLPPSSASSLRCPRAPAKSSAAAAWRRPSRGPRSTVHAQNVTLFDMT